MKKELTAEIISIAADAEANESRAANQQKRIAARNPVIAPLMEKQVVGSQGRRSGAKKQPARTAVR
jgi:hypothetical protein